MDDYRKINSRVPSKEYKDNWDKIFGKKKTEEDEERDLEKELNKKEYDSPH